MASFDYDVVIIGSGFGGSVAALRAAEKGYRVGVMEAGKRWRDEDLPKSQWHLPGFLWFPGRRAVRDPAGRVSRTTCSSSAAPASAAGRTSTPTRCTSRRSSSSTRRSGRASPTGRDELAPHIDQATRMLGVVSLPVHAHRRRSRHAPGRDRDGTRGDLQPGPGGRLLRHARVSRPTIRTSVASDRGEPAASRAASATSAAAATRRTS